LTDGMTAVMACRKRDLTTLKVSLPYLQRNLPMKHLVLFVPDAEVGLFDRYFNGETSIIGQDTVFADMTLKQLQGSAVGGFPRTAGWYYQQLLKYSYAYSDPENDYYLIWDADTIPLRPLDFLDAEGRMIFTKSDERHAPYFRTYRRLLEEDADVEYSFISQHQIIRKSMLREMLGRIELIHGRPWPWAIVGCLEPEGYNQFSEYETYGHYVKRHHPEEVSVRELPWLRNGTGECGYPPRIGAVDGLADRYAFASFEQRDRAITRWKIRLLQMLGKL